MNSILAEITDDQKKQLMEQIVAISSGKTVDQFAISSETPAEPGRNTQDRNGMRL